MPKRVRLTALVPLALACAACAVPSLFPHLPALALALQRGFALVCHQHPERSIVFFGGSVAVCARCLGIYLGAAAGLLFRAPRQLGLKLLAGAVALNGMDWLAELAGLHGNWMLVRFVLGIALGSAAAMTVGTGLKRPTLRLLSGQALSKHGLDGARAAAAFVRSTADEIARPAS